MRFRKHAKRLTLWTFISLFVLLVLALFSSSFLISSDKPRSEIIAKYAGPQSIFVTLPDGTTVHLRDQGNPDGPVLVLLHGFAASLHSWEPWVAVLADEYRLISIDLPGHGITGSTPAADYSRQSMSDFLHSVVNWRNLDRFILVGHSMGGGVALNYTLDHPQKIAGLVLIGASGLQEDSGDTSPGLFSLENHPILARLMRYITPRDSIRQTMIDSYGLESHVTEALVDRYHDLLLHGDNRAAMIKRLLQKPTDAQMDRRLPEINVPVLLLWGSADRLVELKYAKRMRSLMTTSELIIYQGLGHMPMEVIPDVTARDMDRFIKAEITR